MPGLLYDTGALVAAERRHPMIWRLHDRANAAGIVPVVPVVVLAQAWRAAPQHNLSRLLRGCRILPDDEIAGRAAGESLRRGGHVRRGGCPCGGHRHAARCTGGDQRSR